MLESSFAEKGLIALVDNRLDVDQQGAFATKAICKLGSLGKSIAARSRKVIFPLYLAFEITSGILCMVLGSPVQGRLEQIRAECSRGPRSWRQAPGVMGKEKLGSWVCSALGRDGCSQPPDGERGEDRAELCSELRR